MSTFREHGGPRKLLASLLVFALVGGVQWFIYCRTRPPEPKIEFPKELRDIAP